MSASHVLQFKLELHSSIHTPPLQSSDCKYTVMHSSTQQQRSHQQYWFVPNAPSLVDKDKKLLREVVKSLLEIKEKRKGLEYLEDSETVTVLKTVFDAMINDSCVYVSGLNNSLHMHDISAKYHEQGIVACLPNIHTMALFHEHDFCMFIYLLRKTCAKFHDQ